MLNSIHRRIQQSIFTSVNKYLDIDPGGITLKNSFHVLIASGLTLLREVELVFEGKHMSESGVQNTYKNSTFNFKSYSSITFYICCIGINR